MADTKFSALTAEVTPAGTDEFGVNQGGTSKKVTLSQIRQSDGTTPTVISVGAEFTSTAVPTATLPGTHAANDILLLLIQTSNQDFAAPAGYTQLGPKNGIGTAAAAGATKLCIFWKRDNGSESAPTLTDSGDHTYGVMLAVRGCSTNGDPFRMIGQAWKFTASTTGTSDAGKVRVGNSLVMTIWAHALDQAGAAGSGYTNAGLTNITEQFDDSTTDGTGGGIVVMTGIPTSTGNLAASTMTWSGSTVDVSTTIYFPPADAFPIAKEPDVQTFIGSPANLDDVWTKPSSASKVLVQGVGGGASGSAGRNAATAAGGGGGGGGMYAEDIFDAEDLTATVTVHAGNGGAATANTDGAASNAGAASTFSSSSLFTANAGQAATASATGAGGAGGAGGGFASATTPAAAAFADLYGSQPTPGGTGATTAAAGSRGNDFAGGGGAGGGTSQSTSAGGLSRRGGGGGGGGRASTTGIGTGGAGDGGANAGGGANTAGTDSTRIPYGGGGGGGGGSTTGQGGVGGFPGGGGGGGGSASGSQRGERGGHGVIMVTTIF